MTAEKWILVISFTVIINIVLQVTAWKLAYWLATKKERTIKMPNWIEGTMKLRGKRDDISRFIHEGIHGYDYLGEKERPKNEYLRDSSTEDELFCEIYNGPHIDGTRRMFINDTSAFLSKEEGVCCFNVRAALAFISNDKDKDNLIAIADKYSAEYKFKSEDPEREEG